MKFTRVALLLLLLLVALCFPLLSSDPATTTIAVFTLFMAAAATGWNIFSGYTGYIALGHAVYFGIGSYTLVLLAQSWHVPGGYLPFLLVPLGGLVAAVFAVPFGWIALRTRRHAFVVITIATFFIMQLMAYNLRSLTRGSTGLEAPIPFDWGGAFFNLPFYYVALALLLLALAASWWVRHSKYGLSLLAIRDDEDRALGLGVKTGPSKLVAFVISAFFVGAVGALHAYFIGSVYPPVAFDALFDVSVALMGFLGGLGTLSGPVLGSLILVPAQQYFTLVLSDSGYYLIIYGVLFLAVMLLLPQGIIPTSRRLWRRWQASGTRSTPTAAEVSVEDQDVIEEVISPQHALPGGDEAPSDVSALARTDKATGGQE
jgi:branched-chain amino acid transport system permease protein